MKISKNNAEHYNWGDICDGWHLVKNQAEIEFLVISQSNSKGDRVVVD